jgi:hypothetical protein
MVPLSSSMQNDRLYRRESKRKSLVQDHPESYSYNFPATTAMNPKSCFKRRQSSSASPKKSVHFSEYSKQYDILHVKDYTDAERAACYFTIEDLTRIRTDIDKTLRVMRTGQLPDTELCYFRGLESELRETRKERNKRVNLAVFAVQEYQADHCNGEEGLDEEWVENVYRNITFSSVASAKRTATFDEFSAEKVYRESKINVPSPITADPATRRLKRRLKRGE